MNLVIVESPTKARTLAKFLGDDYRIEASYGHVRDLPQKKLGIKITQDHFALDYVQTKKQKERTDEIKKISKAANKIILATDPDREGEAIAFHIHETLQSPKSPAKLDPTSRDKSQDPKFSRVTFHEITKTAIAHALENPRELDINLIDAQQARRVLDRLVGYKLSPLLWKKIRRGLSAGRVQSVALRLIVEKERDIEAFNPVEYWSLQVTLQKLGSSKVEQLTVKLTSEEVKNGDQADIITADLKEAKYEVSEIEKKDFRRTPPAPFTTSTLQQAAANRLGWSAKKTMQVAQSLYEQGYITYHRTDSTNIADEALLMVSSFIVHSFGKEYALKSPRIFKTKSKVAQEAHEAIRPTNVDHELSTMNHELNRDQSRLYELIWKRFVAGQMTEVTGETVIVTVTGQNKNIYKLQAKGETISFDGWYRVSGSEGQSDKGSELPELTEGEKLDFVDLTSEQKFTQPPARYNDASLIKTLEEMDIGRPSTYAPTISTILERLYVEKEEKRFKPTSLGLAVNDFLVSNFASVINYEFTAKMEDELDDIANGQAKWEPVVAEFYEPFAKKLEEVAKTAERVQVKTEETGNPCPKCGQGREIIRLGRFGRFLACSRFPECDYKGNWQNKTGQKCPKCTDGDVIQRKTRTGRTFFGCSNYPKCDFASWTKPK